MATVASENRTFRYLDVQDSDARPSASSISPLDSIDSGNNSNWVFAVMGQTNIWSGGIDTAWGNSGNWSLDRAPELFDACVVIPAGCPNYPLLAGPVAIPALAIEAGATLQLNGQTFTVNGTVEIAGTLIATAGETVTLTADSIFTGDGSYTPAQSTLRLAGTAAQTFAPGGNTFHALDIVNTNAVTVTDGFTTRDLTFPPTRATMSFGSGFTATDLRLIVSDGATLTFAEGAIFTVNNQLVLRGAPGNPVVLTSSDNWDLNVNGYAIARFVDVTGSDASGGRTIYAVDAVDRGNNSNWNFDDGKLWIGSDSSWITPANWSPSGEPTATAVVLIDGSAAAIPRLQTGTTIAGLLVAGVEGSAAFTVDMPFDGSDALMVDGHANIGAGGILTHTANGSAAQYRLAVSVNGNLTVAAGGAVDVTGRGYSINNGPGTPGFDYAGGSHGGEGGRTGSTGRGATYGSITAPVALGSGGRYAVTAGCGLGGGAVRVTAENLHIDGMIRADAPDSPSSNNTGGAGGSVFLTSGTLTGNGIVSANGGNATRSNTDMGGGGGGRIAVLLTSAHTFGDVTFSAVGGAGAGSGAEGGAAGTVYLKGQDDPHGRLVVNNDDRATGAMTVFTNATYQFDSITLTNRACFSPGNDAVLDLSNNPSITMDGGPDNIRSRLVFGRPDAAIAWPDPIILNGTFSQFGTNAFAFPNDVTLATGSVLTHEANTSARNHTLNIEVAGELTIESDAAVDVIGRGYSVNNGPGTPGFDYAGGSHGGEGGRTGATGRGATYGSIAAPITLGSGGNYAVTAGYGRGGGAVRITAENLHIDGVIRADAPDSPSSNNTGGAGGAVFLTAGTLTGNGAISANGGKATRSNTDMGGGGGGRIAVLLTNAHTFGDVTFSAVGGAGAGGGAEGGAAGTVYLRNAAQGAGKGSVAVNNNDLTTLARTPLPPSLEPTLNELRFAAVILTNRGALAVTTSDRIGSLTVVGTNEPLHLGSTDTVLEVGALAVDGTAYTQAGLYTVADWNGFPTPPNITGDGAILIEAKGSLILLR